MKQKWIYAGLVASLMSLYGCGQPEESVTNESDTPGNIYEVNVRQYTPEGSFKAFQQHLPRLKQMGVEMLWFMPVTPISVEDRKGSLGSYYAVADYKGVNPEFGNLSDWKALVKAAQAQGMKVIVDWVANHTGADNHWLKSHPDFFIKDSTGNAVYAFDWSDTRDLDYDNMELQDSMIAAMQFWIDETGIDGFRCDVAGEVPTAFWQKAIPAIRAKSKKNLFFLAEGEKPELIEAGFNASYAWKPFHAMVSIAKGEKSALLLDTVLAQQVIEFPADGKFLYFTSNHDENSWNGSDYETFPGKKHAPFAVLTQTLPNGIPLVYSGQEEPVLRAIPFFEKDTIPFKAYQRAPMYKKLQELRKQQRALFEKGSFDKIAIGDANLVYAFSRKHEGKEVIVFTNLSDAAQNIHLENEIPQAKYHEVFTNEKIDFNGHFDLHLEPWSYKIYVKQ
jgi:alpha-amylase